MENGLMLFPFAFSSIFIIIWCFSFLIGIASFVVWLLAFIDAASRPEDKYPDDMQNAKLIWILILIFTGVIGAILYYFLVYTKVSKK